MFSEQARKYRPWSMSKAQTAHRCPRAFKLQYVDFCTTGTKIRGDNLIGNAVHTVLDFAIRKQFTVRDAIPFAANHHKLTSPELDELLAYVHSMESFITRFDAFCKSKNPNELHTEKKFGMDFELKPVSFGDKKNVFFRGVWDVIARVGDYLIILDHKSGEVKPIEHHTDQLNLYTLAGVHCYPGIKGVQNAIHYVQSEEIVWQPMVPVDHVMRTIVPWYIDYIERAAKNTELGVAVKNDYCAYCSFQGDCPALQKR